MIIIVKMAFFKRVKLAGYIVSLVFSFNVLANENVPEDIPKNIVEYYLNGLGEYATARNNSLSAKVFNKKVIDNLVRSEVLSFIARQEDISADTLFNTLGLFDTYSKLIDSIPQKLLMDIAESPMEPDYVFKQIELAYNYYQNEVVNIGFKIETEHLPVLSQQDSQTLALQN